MIDFNDYEEINVDEDFKPQVGDIVYHQKYYGSQDGTVEIVIDENTDLIQTEFYPLLLNFGCILLRKKQNGKIS